MKGLFFVIDGVDGSGKGTQSNLIYDRLIKEGYKVKYFDFPRYNDYSSIFIRKYLNGDLGKLSDIDAYEASTFFALDRYAAKNEIQKYIDEGYVILCNRYISSNQIHQSSKIEDEKELDIFLDWLDDFEFNKLKIPRPDKVIFLDMDWKIGRKLVKKKESSQRKYVDGKVKDLHEEDDVYMSKSYDRALGLCDRFENWDKIKCYEGSEPLQIEIIHEKIYDLVVKYLNDQA